MKIVEVTDYAHFLSLREQWHEVLKRCNHSIFSTWEWLSTWWKHFGSDKKLLILLAKENGKIVGIAPLMYSVQSMFGLKRGKIEFIGTHASDYTDFILTENKEKCVKSFIAHLNNIPEKWEYVDLLDIPQNAECLSFIQQVSKDFTKSHKCYSLSLPDSHEIFKKRLSKNLRYYLRRNLRKLSDSNDVNFVDYSNNYSLNKGMNILFELHQKRWTSQGFSGVFAEEKIRNFHIDVAQSFSENGWLGLYSLDISDKPVSATYGFKYQSTFYGYLSGLDPEYSQYTVGNLLLDHVINRCISAGLTCVDFLRGDEDYKNRWKARHSWNYQSILIRKGCFSSIQHWLYDKYWRQGNRLKYVLRM